MKCLPLTTSMTPLMPEITEFSFQKENGKKFLLFVRENKKDTFGFTTPYYCLGLVDYVNSTGDRPMNITWRMHNDIPGFILDKAMKLAVG